MVTVLDVLRGDPPTIVTRETFQGRGKPFTQAVQVLDPALFERLLHEVSNGDTIEVIVVTEFQEQGYVTYLDDFHTPG
ncbi:MAG TPA: hypothetical protein VER55_07775 [Ardenticatenaceae bacterium]|nr:hypothetical protein [Ardenticatenaceae bacterium]